MKAVDEKLANYQFEYTGTSDDDLFDRSGIRQYDIGTKGAWYTEERAKKSLSFHLNQSERASSDLLSEKKMNRNTKPLMTLLRIKGNWFLSLHRMLNGMSSPATTKKHQDAPIELTAAESFKVADAYAWVLEGRYDAFFDIKLSFEKAVT